MNAHSSLKSTPWQQTEQLLTQNLRYTRVWSYLHTTPLCGQSWKCRIWQNWQENAILRPKINTCLLTFSGNNPKGSSGVAINVSRISQPSPTNKWWRLVARILSWSGGNYPRAAYLVFPNPIFFAYTIIDIQILIDINTQSAVCNVWQQRLNASCRLELNQFQDHHYRTPQR